MSNHVHLLVKEGNKPLEEFMKKLGISYSYRYNHKYDRIGHLFQDRFKSEPIDDDAYFMTVFRYVHQNPVKAGLPPFNWTSYDDYEKQEGMTDTDFALSLFLSRSELMAFLEEEVDEKCMEYEGKKKLTDGKAAELICKIGKVKHCQALQDVEIKERNRRIRELKSVGLSIRQIERLTGINRGIIARL